MSIRLILVDDQEMIRMGMAMSLNAAEGMEVVGQASTGAQAVELVRRVPADVVLMDIRMPDMDGIEATRIITGGAEESPSVLVFTTFDTDDYALGALAAGASGFLLKDCPVDDLLSAIRHVHTGDAVIAPSTTRRLIRHVSRLRSAPDPRLSALTEREREVLLLLAQGLSNAEIAQKLVLTVGTVKVHVGHILDKLQVRDRLQAVILAYQSGITNP